MSRTNKRPKQGNLFKNNEDQMSPSKKNTWNLAQKYIKMGASKQVNKKCDSGYFKEPT